MLKNILFLGLLAASSPLSAEYITGASVGYLIEGEDPIATVRFGYSSGLTPTMSQIFEAEVGYMADDGDGGDSSTVPFMANYRLQVSDPLAGLALYTGVGIGFSKATLKYDGYGEDDDIGFTWQVLAGVEYEVAHNVSVRLGYRYIKIEEVDLFGHKATWGSDNALELGASYSF